MPVAFAENRGQWSERTLFKTSTGGASFDFQKNGVTYLFTRDSKELIDDANLIMPKMSGAYQIQQMPDKFNKPQYKKETLEINAQFINCNQNVEIIGENELSTVTNFYLGNDPSKWRTDVPSYSSITYKNIYPGIDLKYHGDGKSMKYDFIIHPGAEYSKIQIRYNGVEGLNISNNGDLEVQTSFGTVFEKHPYIYQEIESNELEIAGSYKIIDGKSFGFSIDGEYNHKYSLIVDPSLEYSTYFESSANIAVDNAGNAYVSGLGNADGAVFVGKLSPNGNSLLYNVYFGGSSSNNVSGLAVDGSGNAIASGSTYSSNFPILNAYDPSYNGGLDGFVIKLSTYGTLLYSTYLGGNNDDFCTAVAIDGVGSFYVTGYTKSLNFPMANPYDDSFNSQTGGSDVFVSKFNSSGNILVYSTFLGGSCCQNGYDIAVDNTGHAFLVGYTGSLDFPTVNPIQGNLNAPGGPPYYVDAFITELSVTGTNLIYSTYLGGTSGDLGQSIALDPNGCAYVTGYT
jgi:hypothetical protein